MRWSGQQVRDEGIGDDAALPGLRGLLRSVRTPDFAGTVFHEVEARSALNRVPGTSQMPFTWTVNPYRGCTHACVYCLAGDTPVRLADGGSRPIAELRVGDEVLGTEPDGPGGRRRYVRTTVAAHWSTRRRAHRVSLTDGTAIVTSDEHRFLSDQHGLSDEGWRHVTPGWCRSGRRPHLRAGTVLRGPGPGPAASSSPRRSAEYGSGYLCGLVRADAARTRATAEPFPSQWVELEALARAHHLLAGLPEDGADTAAVTSARRHREVARAGTGPAAPTEPGAADLARTDPAAVADSLLTQPPRADLHPALPAPVARSVAWPREPGPGWTAGFVAGVLDACGEVADGVLRIVVAGEEMARALVAALGRLGFRVAAEPAAVPGAVRLRVRGGAAEHLRLVAAVDPAVGRVRDVCGAPVEQPASGAPRVESVRDLGVEMPMFDITTGTGDFVAAGVISHNCFARNTHTYLDLDAGKDFDSQIVVKVNVARVLERELHAPRWRREPVAMGTNTDPYQRAEGRYRLMPGVIRALGRSGTPFSVLTKGTVLARDLPEIAAAAADVPVGMDVSIALVDRALQAHLEPGTPTPSARLDLVRRITDAGLGCGVMVAPVLPLLTDSAEALDAVLGEIAAAGATGATVLALHLRPGTKEWFMGWLAREYPALVPRYERLYRGGAYLDAGYRRELGRRVGPLLARHGLDRPFPTPRTRSGGTAAPSDRPEGQLSLL